MTTASTDPAGQPDWTGFSDGSGLADALRQSSLTPEQFLAGPWMRFCEMGADAGVNDRSRARTMEFARISLDKVGEEMDEDERRAFFERALSQAESWFADKPDGDYMVEVLCNVSTHNYRGPREEIPIYRTLSWMEARMARSDALKAGQND